MVNLNASPIKKNSVFSAIRNVLENYAQLIGDSKEVEIVRIVATVGSMVFLAIFTFIDVLAGVVEPESLYIKYDVLAVLYVTAMLYLTSSLLSQSIIRFKRDIEKEMEEQ